MMFGIDPLYWIMMLPVLLLSMWASLRVKSAFKKYSEISTQSGISGAQAAKMILRGNGLGHIPVEDVSGFLSDHYDPVKRVLRLSPEVYRNSTIAAIGVAAHETGHALQHARNYRPLMLRTMIAPTASIGSNLAWIIIVFGFIINSLGLVKIGILLFSVVVVFQLITLPVELNASARAQQALAAGGYATSAEMAGVRKVLSAAALTYVAAAASAIVTLLYFLVRAGMFGGSDE